MKKKFEEKNVRKSKKSSFEKEGRKGCVGRWG
jgi:hypothetical protein